MEQENHWQTFYEHLIARANIAMENMKPIEEIAKILTWAEYVKSHIEMGGLFDLSTESTTF